MPNKLSVVEYRAEHIDKILPRDAVVSVSMDVLGAARALVGAGPSWTGIAPCGGVVACGGVVPVWKGVAEAWCLAGHLVHEYKIFFHKFSKAQLSKACAELGLWRVQASVLRENHRGHRWIRSLGFDVEGTLRKYGADGSDYIQYSLLPRQ